MTILINKWGGQTQTGSELCLWDVTKKKVTVPGLPFRSVGSTKLSLHYAGATCDLSPVSVERRTLLLLEEGPRAHLNTGISRINWVCIKRDLKNWESWHMPLIPEFMVATHTFNPGAREAVAGGSL